MQWCTTALLEAVAEASARTGRRVHMHLLETRYQRGWADAEFPDGIVRYLDRIGLLSPRLTLAHCTWARPDELELIGERGATISVSTASNLGLRSGIAPLAEMVRRGCRVALGLDGLALDEDDDGLRDMRLAHLLHGGIGFRIDVKRADILAMAFRNGRRSVLNKDEGGELAAGQPADILLLDWRSPASRPGSARFAVRTHHRAPYPRADRGRAPHRARGPRARHRLSGTAPGHARATAVIDGAERRIRRRDPRARPRHQAPFRNRAALLLKAAVDADPERLNLA